MDGMPDELGRESKESAVMKVRKISQDGGKNSMCQLRLRLRWNLRFDHRIQQYGINGDLDKSYFGEVIETKI